MKTGERAPVVDAVVLAAGLSRRMAPWNKLLLIGADGRPVIVRTLAAVQASRVRHVHVVLGHDRDAMMAALEGSGCIRHVCPDHALGLAHSLRTGLAAVAPDAEAVLVCLGDMPDVAAGVIDAIVDVWQPGAIVVPNHAGRRGNPVLWDIGLLPAMAALTGDTGARKLFAAHAGRVIDLQLDDASILRDADSPAALADLSGGPWRTAEGDLIPGQ